MSGSRTAVGPPPPPPPISGLNSRPKYSETVKQGLVHRETFWAEKYPLHAACREGDKGKINVILSEELPRFHSKALHEFDQDGWAPGHYAAWYGNLPALKLLVEKGYSPSHPSEQGSTVLHFAAGNGWTQLVQFLVHAQPELVAVRDKEGDSPLDVLLHIKPHGWRGISELLQKQNASEECSTHFMSSEEEELIITTPGVSRAHS
eukprot:GCRY01005985.1.p1 GENE.GCRY01005985.1~~GCRY01005985.1.p1  ORF type:complete len:205 (+),score=13.29 GCRY01005985.1:109-723(+)